MRINFQDVLEFRILLGYLRVIMTSQRVLYGVHRYKQLAKGVSDFDTALTYALERRSAFCTVETTIAGVYSGSVRRKGCFRLVTNRFWEVLEVGLLLTISGDTPTLPLLSLVRFMGPLEGKAWSSSPWPEL